MRGTLAASPHDKSAGGEEPGGALEGKTHDVPVTSVEPLDEAHGGALDTVRAGLALEISRGDVGLDLGFGEAPEDDACRLHLDERIPTLGDDGHPRPDGVRPAGEAPEHLAGMVRIRRLPEDIAGILSHSDHGVSSEDDRLRVGLPPRDSLPDRLRLHGREPHRDRAPLAADGFLVHSPCRLDLEGHSEPAQNLAPPRRGRGQDEPGSVVVCL